MLTESGSSGRGESVFKSVAEAAWALQARHERFLFRKSRPEGHPSRVAWVNANNLWRAQVQAAKAGRLA